VQESGLAILVVPVLAVSAMIFSEDAIGGDSGPTDGAIQRMVAVAYRGLRNQRLRLTQYLMLQMIAEREIPFQHARL
jgi:hypothetical protein